MNTSAIGLTFKGKARTAGYNNQHHNHQVAAGDFNKAQFNKNKASMNMPHNVNYSQTDTFHRSAPGVQKYGNGKNAHVTVEQTLPAQIFTKEAIEGISDYIGGTASTGKPVDPTALQRIIAFLTAWFVAMTGTLPNPNAEHIRNMTGTILNPPGIYEEYKPDDDVPPPFVETIPEGTEPEETTPDVPSDTGDNGGYPDPPTTETTDPSTTEPTDPPTTNPTDPEETDPGKTGVDTLPEDITVEPKDPNEVVTDDNSGSKLPDPEDKPITGGDTTDTTGPDGPKIEVDTDDNFSGDVTDDTTTTESEETTSVVPPTTEPVKPPKTEPEDTDSDDTTTTESEETTSVVPPTTEPVKPPKTDPEDTDSEDTDSDDTTTTGPDDTTSVVPPTTEPVKPPKTEPEDTDSDDTTTTGPDDTETVVPPTTPVAPPIIRDEEDEF